MQEKPLCYRGGHRSLGDLPKVTELVGELSFVGFQFCILLPQSTPTFFKSFFIFQLQLSYNIILVSDVHPSD